MSRAAHEAIDGPPPWSDGQQLLVFKSVSSLMDAEATGVIRMITGRLRDEDEEMV